MSDMSYPRNISNPFQLALFETKIVPSEENILRKYFDSTWKMAQGHVIPLINPLEKQERNLRTPESSSRGQSDLAQKRGKP